MTTTPEDQRQAADGATQGGHVDLGSAADVDAGDALALRHWAEGGVTGGIPTLEREAPPSPLKKRGLLRGVADAYRSYMELRRTPYGMRPAMILGLLAFFGVLEARTYSTARPFIVRDLEIEVVRIVDITIIIGAVAAFLAIAAGWWLDRHTRAPWVGIGAIFGAFAGLATSRAASFATLAVPRVGGEVADEVGGVPRFSLLADYYPPEDRGKVFALMGVLRRGAILGAIFAGGISLEVFDWRPTLAAFSLPLLLIGVYSLVRLREPVRGYMERRALGLGDDAARVEDEPQSFGEGWRTTFSVRTLRRLFIADVFTNGADSIVTLFLLFFLVEEYGLGPFQVSLFILPSLLASIVGGFYGGVLVDRLIRRNPGRVLMVFGVFSAISAVGIAGYVIGPPLWVLVAFSAVFGFGSALIGPATASVYSQVVPANIRTQGFQITGLAVIPGLVLLAPIARAIFGEYGYASTFAFAVPLALIGGLIAMTAGSFFDIDARSAFAASVASEEWRRAKASGRGKLLVCRDVDVEYDGVQVLFGVDFDVEEGQIIALLGTNGAGKSTLLRAISGTQQASGGAVVFDGRDITHMPPHEVAGRGVIHMPGGRGVFPDLTVRENLLMANWLTDDPDEIRLRLADAFEIFPVLRARSATKAAQLSGGEQQQLSLAQAFITKPRLLMIDELSLGLSPAVVGQLLDIVREIHRRGVTIIVVEQSVNVALTIAEKAIFMEKGEVRFYGDTADLLARPDILRSVYVKGTGALTAAPVSSQRQHELIEAPAVLQVRDLVKRYGGVTAVDGVSFDLRDGEVLGLIGPNGAGKTTIFELISGFQKPDAGRIGYEGLDITDLSPEARAQRGLIRRFQDARLFPSLTLFETLLVALEQHHEVRSTMLQAAAMPQARRSERRLHIRAERLVELLDLGSYRDKFVKELSTGLRRITDLACVLATEPKVLLLDEPSSGIAQAEAEALAPLLGRIRHETGCSILIIEHDMSLISSVSDELIALHQGGILLQGTADEVLNDDRVIESYLGTSEETVHRSGSL